jgi:hypothetical protein
MPEQLMVFCHPFKRPAVESAPMHNDSSENTPDATSAIVLDKICFWLLCIISSGLALAVFNGWAQKAYAESISHLSMNMQMVDIGPGGFPSGGGGGGARHEAGSGFQPLTKPAPRK